MADTPETPARKSVTKAPKKAAVKVAKAKPVKASATVISAAKPAPVRKPRAKKASTAPAATGWTAQIAPLKAKAEEQIAPLKAKAGEMKVKAEKAARAASEKLQEIDWKAQIDPIREQAGKTAKSAAGYAKDSTGTAMQSLAKLISETAGTVDAKLGPQYGDYARQAAQSVASAADTLDSKDVDQLMAEARDFVRKSPAVAIGAAAVVGFVLMRLAKGSDEE